MIADRDLEIEAMKEVIRKNCSAAGATQLWGQLVKLQVPERRSCQLVGMPRSAYQRRLVKRKEDEELEARLQVIAREHPQTGYRTAWAMLRREGCGITTRGCSGWGRADAATEAQASAPVGRPGSGHPRGPCVDLRLPPRPDGECAPVRMLTVVDEYSRECRAITADAGLSR